MEYYMPRQSITLSPSNDSWLKQKADGDEFQSKSEVINSLIRDARKGNERVEWVRAALIEGEKSGTSKRTPEDIRQSVLKTLKANGGL